MSIGEAPTEARLGKTSRVFAKIILVAFIWVLFGICLIYGIRLYFKAPPNPAFVPLIAATFCTTIAFTIVLSLEYVAGKIVLKVANTEFQGASGPIVMWCLSFLIVALGLTLLGITDAAKKNEPADGKTIWQLIKPN